MHSVIRRPHRRKTPLPRRRLSADTCRCWLQSFTACMEGLCRPPAKLSPPPKSHLPQCATSGMSGLLTDSSHCWSSLEALTSITLTTGGLSAAIVLFGQCRLVGLTLSGDISVVSVVLLATFWSSLPLADLAKSA